MTNLHAIILGLVEGITEYLPVSSTGHLIIATNLLGLTEEKEKAAIDAFEVVVQGGAILAVLGLYWPRFVQMLRGVLGKDNAGFQLFVNVCVAFIPAAVVGVLLKSTINKHLFFAWPVVLAFIVGGIYMILVEARRSGKWANGATVPYHGAGKDVEDMTPLDAFKIGCLQIMALWPGTSRSMMTITGGYFCKLRPAAAAEFSFLLGMPTLLAATVLTMWGDWKDHKANGSPMFYDTLGKGPVLIGLIVAAISAALAVKWLVGFLNRRGLAPFGVYRILLGIALIGLILGGLVHIQPESKDAGRGSLARPAPIAPAAAPAR